MQETQIASESLDQVQRDMDLIRDLLLKIESNPEMDGTSQFPIQHEALAVPGHSPEEIRYHLDRLYESGYVTGQPLFHSVSGLTMAGHDFLDSIKTPSIWEETKQKVAGLSGFTLKIAATVAESLIMKHLGLK